ncbi:MAG: aspartate carbamoyltransferase [Oscillospiraceae bacterium]
MRQPRHLISPSDLTISEVDDILDLAGKIIQKPADYSHLCDGKKIATLFYEPSTRTRLSFEAAMMELGGGTLGFSSADSSSAAKGETVADTIKTVQCFADIIAIRHPKEGSAQVAASVAQVPVINAGDGGHQHPTQTLTDLLTIRTLKKDNSLENLTIGLCGDLMFGRTVHSLVRALLTCKNIRFVMISPTELRLPAYLTEQMAHLGVEYKEVERMDEVLPELDVLYMTRVQRERFFNEEDYVRLRDSYILDAEKMKLAKADMMVLHPLPRVNEIAIEVDDDPRAAYFKQVLYGKYVRMALILKLMEVQGV